MKQATETQYISRYEAVSDEKADGVHYTPRSLAEFVAKQIAKCAPATGIERSFRILDPAVGDGELLLALLRELIALGFSDFDVHGFDTSGVAIKRARERLSKEFPSLKVNLREEDFLKHVSSHESSRGNGDLFALAKLPSYDLVISNPPYVRTQVLGAEQSKLLSRQFDLTGRIDLYYAFILAIADVLSPGGVAGIIVSNRFMTTKSGTSIRSAMPRRFDIMHIWDLGDTKLFEAAVLPAVILAEKRDSKRTVLATRFTSIYSAASTEKMITAPDVITALEEHGTVRLDDGRCFEVQQGILEHGGANGSVWRIATKHSEDWLAQVEMRTWRTFGDIGKIRVGVKTTADKVFIRSYWDELPIDRQPEKNLLRPLITHHHANQIRATQPKGNKLILYPHQTVHGKRSPVDLTKYPRAAKYLAEHRGVLEGRKYVIEAGRKWYEIWVPQDPDAWSLPKVVFRDISEHPTFWMDLEGGVVNGDCYWLTLDTPDQQDTLWLALAVGNSTFIEKFYDHKFNNKLYAGRRRFITQYVEKFPLPDPSASTSQEMIQLVKQVYELLPSEQAKSLQITLDNLVWQAFGLSVEEVAG